MQIKFWKLLNTLGTFYKCYPYECTDDFAAPPPKNVKLLYIRK